VPGATGRRLDIDRAETTIVRALASLERGTPVALPVAVEPASVTATDLARAARQARIALSAPVRLTHGETRWRLPRWRIAELLALPSGGSTKLAIAGPGAERYFERLSRTVGRDPKDATFAVTSGGISVVPARDGIQVDVPATASAILAAAVSPRARTAPLAVEVAKPERSTADANAMGITGVVGSYTTTYGGTPGRLHNVQLVAHLIDGALIAPGATFSFNGTTGERNADKGFQEAPVIINGELQNGLGGGVCQVSTTVFNSAYEAGLQIDQRTNHALYIDHYPTGRDATVNYPDLDLKFTNDTRHWLLLRAFAGSGSLTVNLYGTPQSRRVESETGDLVVTGPVPVRRIEDPSMFKGESEVETTGVPPRRTSVHRKVYLDNGTLLHDNIWSSNYVGEPTVIRVGTKPRPKKKQEQPPKKGEQTQPTGETPTTSTTPDPSAEPPVTTAP
jgi:vancomycin resistance protein YoaR